MYVCMCVYLCTKKCVYTHANVFTSVFVQTRTAFFEGGLTLGCLPQWSTDI